MKYKLLKYALQIDGTMPKRFYPKHAAIHSIYKERFFYLDFFVTYSNCGE